MATIDEELATLEKDIRQLKVEYDQYFGGGRKRPPTEIEWRIDLLIKRYAERGGDLKFAQRFRFNNLSQTYAKRKKWSSCTRRFCRPSSKRANIPANCRVRASMNSSGRRPKNCRSRRIVKTW